MLAGSPAALSAPIAVALDPIHGEIVVVHAANQTVTAYPRGAGFDTPPLRALGGPGAGSRPGHRAGRPLPRGAGRGERLGSSITARPAHGQRRHCADPALRGPATGLAGPYGLALDLAHDELVVTSITSHAVTVYARTAHGDVAPLRTVKGPATGLAGPRGVAVDPVHGEIVVANIAAGSVTVHARAADGNAAPLRTLAGPQPG